MSVCPLRLALPPGLIASGPLLGGILYPSSPVPPAPYVEIVSIESLTGDGELVGWSEYSHARFDPAAPIKYLSRTLAGSISETSFTGPDGTGSVIYSQAASYPYPATGSQSIRWEGTARRDETGLTDAASRFDTYADWAGFLPETGPFATESANGANAGTYNVTTTATVKTLTGAGTVNDTRTYAPRGSYVAAGIASETLSDPDTVFAALLRGSATAGTLATTEAGTVADTAPESYGPQAVTGFTAVRVTGRIVGGNVGMTYGVRVGLARAQIMPPAYSNDSDWLNVTVTGDETLFTYDVPVTPNFLTRFVYFAL